MAEQEDSDVIEEVLFGAPSEDAGTVDARLVVVAGRASQAEVALALPAVLGRGSEATVLVKHETVSRAHCEIREVKGELVVRDLGSKNGTFVDGARIKESALRPESKLTVGPLTFRVEYEQPVPARRDTPSVPAKPAAPANGAPPKPAGDDEIDFFLSDLGQ